MDPRGRARVHAAAESAKKRLSENASTGVALVDLPLGRRRLPQFETTISREDAEEAWAPLLTRLHSPIARALRDASLSASRIDEVLLVGGATRMPCVVRLVAQVFGKLPLRVLPPDEAVAMGAAVQAALKSGNAAVEDLVATDVAPFTLGIEASSSFAGERVEGVFSPILERGTVIPASRVQRYVTVADWQKTIRVRVYQGEHSLCRDNQKLGEYEVTGIRSAAAGEESVDVRFTYDLNGMLEVETTIVSTKKTETMVIERSPGRLSPAQVKAARSAMVRLKFHPRDALPNTTALARAEALFVELSGAPRERLGAAMAAFRAILEGQEPDEIERGRQSLVRVIDAARDF